MSAFGAAPHEPTYVGGGDLWEEPVPQPRDPRKYTWAATLFVVVVASIIVAILW